MAVVIPARRRADDIIDGYAVACRSESVDEGPPLPKAWAAGGGAWRVSRGGKIDRRSATLQLHETHVPEEEHR